MAAFVGVAPEHKLRVVAPDVGGGFGSKIFIYAEECVVTWAVEEGRRPPGQVDRRPQRGFLTDAHGRDHVTHAELALDAQGKFLALRVEHHGEHGRLPVDLRLLRSRPTSTRTLLAGQYKTPAIYCEVKAVFTNTAPVDAYRGAGRPEATFLLER